MSVEYEGLRILRQALRGLEGWAPHLLDFAEELGLAG